ncbi:zinc ribbon domain-containing protein [Anaeromyxobacter oryzae]|uniref:Uncharacterized protein n=1 Tax=Anaeromyxobacter oryzae TaxID=2918170 RepID=A0ABM7WVY6_9BACT|nr:hypothetical protein [Anaeromyxobacter oryzae]BDG03662.1 hypothetical protein AMOR_26580 [Anaeromyxobacter oryzae]
MADEQRRSGGGGFLAWLLILALLAVVVWLASERNARTWYLAPDEGRLVVLKGYMLPAGRQVFKTNDPALAQAYAPIVLPPGKAPPPEQSFDDRSALDQALYDLLAGWAREDIGSGDPSRLERGLAYIDRAEHLGGVSQAQRQDLAALRGESGYFEAQKLLERATDELRDASAKLGDAARSRSSHAMDAQLLLKDVDAARDAAMNALRASNARQREPGQRAPAPTPTPPPTNGGAAAGPTGAAR